ncbi:MAG: 30S ribosomal protein S20 [Kiritimatiellia bacterium]|jgi:small subunit ribosomal protein S20
MPNIKSAIKRVRQSAANRAENRAVKSSVATSRRKLIAAVESGDKAQAAAGLADYTSQLDKAAKKGVIAKNNAARKKSRVAQRVAKMA